MQQIIHCKNRLVIYHRFVNLVAWLNVVSEDNCINKQEGSFLVVSSSFSYLKLKKVGRNNKDTGCLYMLVSSTKLNHATKLFLKKQIYISSLPVNANDVASSLTLSSCEE